MGRNITVYVSDRLAVKLDEARAEGFRASAVCQEALIRAMGEPVETMPVEARLRMLEERVEEIEHAGTVNTNQEG